MITRTALTKSFHTEMMSRGERLEKIDGYNIPQRMSWEEIDWDSMKPVAGGAYGYVFQNGKHALKIGSIDAYSPGNLHRLSLISRAVNIYGYWQKMRIPVAFVMKHHSLPNGEALESYFPYRYRTQLADGDYIKETADVMAMELAKPFQREELDNDHLVGKIERGIRNVERDLKKHALYWPDSHLGNLGKIGKRYIILDY